MGNQRYLHWHKFRYYQPVPDGITHEELWIFLKMGREVNKKFVPIQDKNEELFTYWVPDSLFKLLHEIDMFGGGTITVARPGILPAKEQYIVSSLMEEAIASSQLEGAATTRQVAKEMLRTGREPIDRSEQMILNNWETMQYIREHRNEKFTPKRILDLHKIITAKTLQEPEEEGRFRTSDDIIVEYNRETIHIPPRANTLGERIQRLCNFANQDQEENWIHPVFKGAMIHFALAYDHPFVDGNGRTARALMYWYMLSRNYMLFEYMAISRYIQRSPAKYVQAFLFTETDSNDLTYFLFYNLKAMRRALDDLRKYIERKQREVADSNVQLRNLRGLNPRQKALVYHAISHPLATYTFEAHRSHHAVVYQTARQDLLDLAKQGYLEKEKQGKEFVFFPSKKIGEKLRKSKIKKKQE
jgi:Fic family protein